MKSKVASFFKSQTVLCISIILAVISMFIIHPSKDYIKYINSTTLILLFSLMGAVCGLRKCGIFDRLSQFITRKCRTVRAAAFLMMNVCFFTSMLITNDVALITFVPVTLLIMKGQRGRSIPLTVIIETAAANLGSMMLPTGNPQNIFLCSFYDIKPPELVTTLLPYGIISYAVLALSVFLLPSASLTAVSNEKKSAADFNMITTASCTIIFIVSLMTVSGILNAYICLAVAVVLIAVSGFDIFGKIDYALLLTFVCFFIFTGNLGRIEAVRDFLSSFTANRELGVSVVASQVFSNVPASILLSGFTDKASMLLIGTNLGGLGTPIASLASLISFKIYASDKASSSGKYMLLFTVYNFVFLGILFASAALLT